MIRRLRGDSCFAPSCYEFQVLAKTGNRLAGVQPARYVLRIFGKDQNRQVGIRAGLRCLLAARTEVLFLSAGGIED